MSTILFTAGAKGGTGKSTAARFLVTYLREHGADPLLLDLDDENRTLSRFFPEALQAEIKKRSSHDILVERALSGDSLIIADLKAGTGREVLDWWLDVPFDELHSRRVRFVCVASITSSPDSVQSFFNWVTALQDRVTYVVFRNLKDGDYLPDCDKSDESARLSREVRAATSQSASCETQEETAYARCRWIPLAFLDPAALEETEFDRWR